MEYGIGIADLLSAVGPESDPRTISALRVINVKNEMDSEQQAKRVPGAWQYPGKFELSVGLNRDLRSDGGSRSFVWQRLQRPSVVAFIVTLSGSPWLPPALLLLPRQREWSDAPHRDRQEGPGPVERSLAEELRNTNHKVKTHRRGASPNGTQNIIAEYR